MKVLLLAPPLKIVKEMEEFARVSFPIGLAYIASSLEKNNLEVSIIDALAQGWNIRKESGEYIRIGLPEEKLIELIKKESPDVVGITAQFTSQKDQPIELASLVKKIFPDVKIVFGGPHASATPEETLKDANVDFIVLGEGENIFLDLLRNLNHPEKVQGIAYKSKNEIKVNLPVPIVENLDDLPFPAYHMLKMQDYFDAGAEGMSARRYVGSKDNWATLITSRSCPYRCNFCSIHNTMGKKWRARSAKNVLDEIEFLYNKYNIRTFFFEDDNFTLDLKRAKEILNGLKERNLKINWQAPNGIRADLLDEEIIALMKKTNCTRVRIAIEHGDQEFLDKVIHKNLDLQKLKESVKLMRKHKLPVDGFFILGIPGETDRTIRNSINFAKELSSLGLNPIIGMAIPLPGTEMYEECIKNNYLTKSNPTSKDYQLAYSKEPLISTPLMPAPRLKKWFFRAFRETILARAKKNPLVLLDLNIVQEFKKHPLRASKIALSYVKSARSR